MSSQLNVDTIVDKAGSGGTNVKVANTSTYVSDGGNVTQNTVQGLAKHWAQIDNFGNIDDSINLASLTDVGTGQSRLALSNSFLTVNNCSSVTMSYYATGIEFSSAKIQSAGGIFTTSQVSISTCRTNTDGFLDVDSGGCIWSMVHGDLA